MDKSKEVICTTKLMRFLSINVLTSVVVLVIIRNVWSSSRLFDQILMACFVIALFQVSYESYKTKKKAKFQPVVHRVLSRICDVTVLTIVTSFLLSLPLLNIDRSRSFYVIYCVDKELISVAENHDLVSSKNGERLDYGIVLRLGENQERGLLKQADSRLVLTKTGKSVLYFGEKFTSIFGLTGYKEIKKQINQSGICLNI